VTAAAPKKRGRPRLGDAARSVPILGRWTPGERDLLTRAAAALNVDRATLIHDAAIAKARRVLRQG
jgi:uncharacterized protein (DUF1778 family)